MIKLTKDSNGQPVYVSPEAINFIEDADGASRIDVPHSLCFVKESPEEVAKKVLEYKLAMARYETSSAAAYSHRVQFNKNPYTPPLDEVLILKGLAGLEDNQ